jgi:hypothetical protein
MDLVVKNLLIYFVETKKEKKQAKPGQYTQAKPSNGPLEIILLLF